MRKGKEIYDKILDRVNVFPETGICQYKHKHNKSRHANSSIGGKTKKGYYRISIREDGKSIYVSRSRLIYYAFHGVLPDNIDHIDRNPSNDKIRNLRSVSYSQNNLNRSIPKNNTSGRKGVHVSNGKYIATIWVDGRAKNLGTFDYVEDASIARAEAEDKYYDDEFYTIS